MRYCEHCKESMYTSLFGLWIKGKYYDVHNKCKKAHLDSLKTSNNNHPTKPLMQIGSEDELDKDAICSAASVEAKTGDLKLTKADKQMLKNFETAGKIVLIEDRKLLEELGRL